MEDQTDNLNVSENDGVVVQEAVFVGSEPDVDVEDAEIRPTDIVFDCPHCGHNLCIDLRGAGLQTKCVECGESVLVPIPDGMKIDDLDLSQGELLTQLFQTRRMFQKSEQRAQELLEELEAMRMRRSELEKAQMSVQHRNAEMFGVCQIIAKHQSELGVLLGRLTTLLSESQQG